MINIPFWVQDVFSRDTIIPPVQHRGIFATENIESSYSMYVNQFCVLFLETQWLKYHYFFLSIYGLREAIR